MKLLYAGVVMALALMLALSGTYVSLHTGLWPLLIIAGLILWLGAAVVCLRATLTGEAHWRLLLPVFLLLLTYLAYGYGLQYLMQEHYKRVGFPHRYYSRDSNR